MRVVAIYLLVLLSAGSASVALGAVPELVVDQPAFTFGSVIQGQKVQHAFAIRNKGSAPLTIRGIRPSCGCTAASTTASVLAPGMQSDIRVTFDSTNFAGSVSKTISLDTDDPKLPIATLTLKGTVVEEIQVAPKQLNLGRIKVDATTTLTLTIANKGIRPLKLLSVTSQLPQVAVRADRQLVKPGETVTVRVAVTPRSIDSFLSGYISIKTDNPTKPEMSVPLFGSLAR